MCLVSWRQILLFVPVEEEEEEDDTPLLLHWKDPGAQGLGRSKPTESFFSGVGRESDLGKQRLDSESQHPDRVLWDVF